MSGPIRSADSGLRHDHLAHFTAVRAVDDPRAPETLHRHALDEVFITESISLSFSATMAQWGGAELDRLYAPDRLDEWLPLVGLLPLLSPASPAQLDLLRELRNAIHTLAVQRVDGSAPDAESVALVNSAASVAGVHAVLDPATFRAARDGATTVPQLAATLAQDAIASVGGPWRDRLKACEWAPCTHLFLDKTPGGKRRWCTSEGCGNRARVKVHRDRASEPEVASSKAAE